LKNLDRFLRKNDTNLSDEELDAFFRVLNLDVEGRISYAEFVETILPTEC
jgi:Ca2+-binding EF-hand superfamily protein